MIDQDKRKAAYVLHKEGKSIREISNQLNITEKSVGVIIEQKGEMPLTTRKDKIEVEPELLRKLYIECEGWMKRVYEKLKEKGIEIGYSTLTNLIRELDIKPSKNNRCDEKPDIPGEEMQHDTSQFIIKIGDKKKKLQASIIYLRYSKIRYLKFYPSFKRFKMKCFFYEALMFIGYCAKVCIIDNTNLARLRGTGQKAIIVSEMEQFAKQFGFEFVCHAVNHPNRKAGNEKSFHFVTSNFLPGRKFESLEDLNEQALYWSTIKIANEVIGKTRIIPVKAFEFEKTYLTKLPNYISPSYDPHSRYIDQYGYISFDGNFYWVPGKKRHSVKVLEYSNTIKIIHEREILAEYILPPYGIKRKQFYLENHPKPKNKPKHSKKPTEIEEKKLRDVSNDVSNYLDFVFNLKGIHKHKFIRSIFCLYNRTSLNVFIKTIKRCLKYEITDIKTIERIAVLQMSEGYYKTPTFEVDEEFKNREAYQEGKLTSDPDLSKYDEMLDEAEDPETDLKEDNDNG